MYANSFYTFLSFRALVLVGVFLLHLEVVFTSARFSLTANVSYGTLAFKDSLLLFYTIFKYEIKKNTILLLVELLAVRRVPYILRHPIYIYIYIYIGFGIK